MSQIFISHSQLDTEIKTFFGDLFGRTNVKALFVEYEGYTAPAWPYIHQEIANSAALFVLLGPNVEELRHTQLWIGTECGAATPGKDVWVFEHSQRISNVPIPNVQHYMMYNYGQQYQDYIRAVVESYDDLPVLRAGLDGFWAGAELASPLGHPAAQLGGALVGSVFAMNAASPAKFRPIGAVLQCPRQDCMVTFRFHTRIDLLPCPTCRRPMQVQWA
ncbi:MAG: hypothetical protein ABSB57_00300 [Dehalococcoidia bacterium]